ncbi:hypothetical protein D3C84_1107460 [compost metagenome]
MFEGAGIALPKDDDDAPVLVERIFRRAHLIPMLVLLSQLRQFLFRDLSRLALFAGKVATIDLHMP